MNTKIQNGLGAVTMTTNVTVLCKYFDFNCFRNSNIFLSNHGYRPLYRDMHVSACASAEEEFMLFWWGLGGSEREKERKT